MNAAPVSSAQLDTSISTNDPTRVDWLSDYPPPRSLRLDREALRVYEHAYAIGLEVEKPNTPPITFSTLLAALLTGRDDASAWFARQTPAYGPDENLVFAEKGTSRTAVEGYRPTTPGKPTVIKLSSDRHLLTTSARSLLGIAEGWAQTVRGSEIGVRHLIAAYVLNPPAAHRAQMRRWMFQESPWRQAFFAWVAERYTAEQWTEASYRSAPAQALPEIERIEVKGSELAFPGDPLAWSVLERAAALHARQSDDWLGIETLWHALIDRSSDPAVGDLLAPIVDAVSAVSAQYQTVVNAYFRPSPQRDVKPFDDLDISPRVSNALETARALATATRHDSSTAVSVTVLHLAGALVSRRVDSDPELISFGLDPSDLRESLVSHAEALGESGDAWRDALGVEETTEAGRPVELNSDEPEAVIRGDLTWADDPLKIRRDVETFASLLASTHLEPPLSIGLFGPWGSGKTTFLKRLRRAVERRANEAQTASAEAPSAYVQNVVHVDFNAWHYSEGALTSSLVDTILRRLGDYITDKKPDIGKAWELKKTEHLESTKRKVEAAEAVVAAAGNAVTKAEQTLREEQTKAAAATIGLRSVAERLWQQTVKSFQDNEDLKRSGMLDALGSTVASTEELRARLESLRNRPARMLRELGWGGTLLFAALVIGVPLFVSWASSRLFSSNGATELISAATAALSVIGVWVRAASSAVAKVDETMERVAEDYAKKVAEDVGLKSAQIQLATAQASASTATAALQAAREELAHARVDAANATLPAQMLQLVTSRLESQSYTKELTTTSLARADLEAMSTLLREQVSDGPSAPDSGSADDIQKKVADTVATAALKRVERVILYIDDLDRCKPEDVVRVLQLVHMLLAFELFAVVVAVDARWVEESLQQSYRWLANDLTSAVTDVNDEVASNGSNGAAHPKPVVASRITPQDYLEKIFQISFWLKPMTTLHAAEYLRSLVRVQPRGAGAAAVVPIEIQAIELDYMRYLAAYVGTSPRRVKRLVNAYRLIKANLTDSQLRTFLMRPSRDEDGRRRSGTYQLVIGLLAIGTGAPASAAQIFREIAAYDAQTTPNDIVRRFREANHPDWSMAAQVIEQVLRSQRANDIRELRDWTANVGRFLLKSPLGEGAPALESALS